MLEEIQKKRLEELRKMIEIPNMRNKSRKQIPTEIQEIKTFMEIIYNKLNGEDRISYIDRIAASDQEEIDILKVARDHEKNSTQQLSDDTNNIGLMGVNEKPRNGTSVMKKSLQMTEDRKLPKWLRS